MIVSPIAVQEVLLVSVGWCNQEFSESPWGYGDGDWGRGLVNPNILELTSLLVSAGSSLVEMNSPRWREAEWENKMSFQEQNSIIQATHKPVNRLALNTRPKSFYLNSKLTSHEGVMKHIPETTSSSYEMRPNKDEHCFFIKFLFILSLLREPRRSIFFQIAQNLGLIFYS